ncbi:glycosyltransferase family 2 protein [Roseivivax isoporae]|uniref:Glycosyl transferase family 2 n=1 Tax=Roseivivax isoporae LMG 25204 TaxID=1449351 RepID=X7F898_9RHOB|nr:glycosyltransferase family 2 protein [Roseivivax isoporae]ETX28309.1 glycosyl transferase family 2 [Roseivivax isoporae LMG 25204]
MRILAILCVRNEGAFLLDWLAHHLAVGVTHILAYSNDCEDGTDAMLDALARTGPLTHHRNEGPHGPKGIQFTALNHAASTPEAAAADWILPLDIDEFVNVHVGARTLPDLIAAVPEATAITLTWRLFGSGGLRRFEDVPVPERFVRAAPDVVFWPWRAAMFKTLYRNDGTYGRPGVHRPRAPDAARIAGARWVDGNGRPLPPGFATARIYSDFGKPNFGLVQLNHYPLGCAESYVLKAARGRAVHGADRLGLDYWAERNFDAAEDRSILGVADRVRTIRASLAADPALARLHEDAVAWRRARFDALMLDESYRALYGRLLMTPPARPLGAAEARELLAWGRAAREADG